MYLNMSKTCKSNQEDFLSVTLGICNYEDLLSVIIDVTKHEDNLSVIQYLNTRTMCLTLSSSRRLRLGRMIRVDGV